MSGSKKSENHANVLAKKNFSNDNGQGEGMNFVYSKAVEDALEGFEPAPKATLEGTEDTEQDVPRKVYRRKKKKPNDKVVIYKLEEIYQEAQEFKVLLEEAEQQRQSMELTEDENTKTIEKQEEKTSKNHKTVHHSKTSTAPT